MSDLAAPLWVERIASDVWPRIVAVAPKPAWVPVHTAPATPKGRFHFEELGCGHYGCVMPTSDPEVVCKITSDPTEAVFIAAAATLGEAPEGIVRYHGIYELGETFKGRPTFVLWREAATSVGLTPRHAWPPAKYGDTNDAYELRRRDNLARYLGLFKEAANAARESLKRKNDPAFPVAARERRLELLVEAKKYEDWAWQRSAELDIDRVIGSAVARVLGPYRGAMRLAMALRLCALIAEVMQNTDGSDLVGSALRDYLDEGILLADVHANNVGKVERTPGWVITDPGHAVGLEARWDAVTIPRLP